MADSDYDEWCIITVYKPVGKDPIIHCYGDYPTRSKAKTAMVNMRDRHCLEYTKAELRRVTYTVRPVFKQRHFGEV